MVPLHQVHLSKFAAYSRVQQNITIIVASAFSNVFYSKVIVHVANSKNNHAKVTFKTCQGQPEEVDFFIDMCFLSIAPRQWGIFECSSKPETIFFPATLTQGLSYTIL